MSFGVAGEKRGTFFTFHRVRLPHTTKPHLNPPNYGRGGGTVTLGRSLPVGAGG